MSAIIRDVGREALWDLLDRYESRPDSQLLFIHTDKNKFSSAREEDAFQAALRAAADAGAVELRFGKRHDRDRIEKAKLIDANALYCHLGRTPSADAAAVAIGGLRAHDAWQQAAIEDVRMSWSLGKPWCSIPLTEPSLVQRLLDLAAGIVAEGHAGLDYRTYSRRVAGDSKLLENNEAAVVRLIAHARPSPAGLRPREILQFHGLERVAQALHVSGPLAFASGSLSEEVPYVGLPHQAAAGLRLTVWPRAVVTIENFVSFHRYATELNSDLADLVVWTSGQPSLSLQRSLKSVIRDLPADIPRYHWSDIDVGGVHIFRTIESLVPGLRPHLMDESLAESRGLPTAGPTGLRVGQASASAIAPLWDYLAGREPRFLEQEELDPVRP